MTRPDVFEIDLDGTRCTEEETGGLEALAKAHVDALARSVDDAAGQACAQEAERH